MELRNAYRYAIACPSSMGVRITPERRMQVENSSTFYMQATSAETNALSIASSLGRECLVLTRFVAGSPIAAFIKSQLRARNIAFEGPDVEQGGPWGYRHQFNIADTGFGLRGPRVWNDRAGEVGRYLSVSDYDIDRLFGEEGVAILHLSGLIASMSPETTSCCLALVRAAKEHGTLVSFDLNYRDSFWKGRERELIKAFTQIASEADVLIGGVGLFPLCLGVEAPREEGGDAAAGGSVCVEGGTDALDGSASRIDAAREMLVRAKEKFPNVELLGTTLRDIVSANKHQWGAAILADGVWAVEEQRPIEVLDRIGGGDGFAGGVLYGVLNGWNAQKCLQFGWAAGVLAVSTLNDYAEPADESQLWDIVAGDADVQR